MKDIPIFINNKEHLTDLKGLVSDLHTRGYTNIHIMDNASTYPPLLEYYKESGLNVHYFSNYGDKCLWNSGLINDFSSYPFIILTTSDIRLNPNAPDNFVDLMIEKYNQYPEYGKVGLALALDFETKSNYQKWSYDWELQFWQNKLEDGVYQADVDTTFCLFKPGPHQYKAIRLAGDFTSRHMTWYINFDEYIPEEELYYLDQVTNESFYKGFYQKWLDSKSITNVSE